MDIEEYTNNRGNNNNNNNNNNKPTGLLNSIFTTTVNVAAKTLVSVASNSKAGNNEKWKAKDHLNFMVMMMTWLTLWVLRVLMDTLPNCLSIGYTNTNTNTNTNTCSSNYYLLGDSSSDLSGSTSSAVGSWDLVPSSMSGSSALSTLTTSGLVLQEEVDRPSIMALGLNCASSATYSLLMQRRTLSENYPNKHPADHQIILALINEIPATSRKYQFALSMAENIMDENSQTGHLELQQVNRSALASAFSRTLTLLYQSLNRNNTQLITQDSSGPLSLLSLFPARAILKALPLGSMVQSYMKGVSSCLNAVLSLGDMGSNRNQKSVAVGFNEELYADVYAEKLAQELLWITNKLRAYGAADEALVQWSYASGLSTLSLSASARVQGYIIKVSAILIGELTRDYTDMSTQVKFKLLALWLPLFCHSSNGLAYPILTSFEKLETEKAMDEVIESLPAMDQEVILTNWLQDFAISSSDWPNLQVTYDRWCQFTQLSVNSLQERLAEIGDRSTGIGNLIAKIIHDRQKDTYCRNITLIAFMFKHLIQI
ncbi:hypothetical protein ACFE04_021357 [Oxalis oulophora]